jgi:hypothetical protein
VVLPANINLGSNYYTQFVIRYEKQRHLTTNYRRGASIPVNSPVRLVKIEDNTIEIELLDSSAPLVIRNIPKHTGDDIYQTFDKLFASNKVDLSQFSQLEREQIKTGTVSQGMSKNAVVVAIGYPPITETLNLDADTWVYWSGRFNKFNVIFSNGKVSSVVD